MKKTFAKTESLLSPLFFLAGLLIMLVPEFSQGQTITSQDFEGPLTGWYNEGTLTGGENGVSPFNGSGMLSLSTNEHLTSPNVVLPSGQKYVSFAYTSYNSNTFLTYSMEVNLLQNGNYVLTLGTFTTDPNWSSKVVNVPAGYSGSNYSIDFHVLNYSNAASLRFYVDDIILASGVPTPVNENSEADIDVTYNFDHELCIKSADATINAVKVISLDGKVLLEERPFSNEFHIQKEFSSCMILLHVETSKGVINRKLLID